jgi:YVTN family beta-propeller protein
MKKSLASLGLSLVLLITIGINVQAPKAAQVPHTIYVMNRLADTISVVDGVTFVVAATIQTNRNPREILVDESKDVAYFSSQWENTVTVIDLRSLKELARIPVPGAPHGLALSADGATLFSAATGGQAINVIDLATRHLVASIPVGEFPGMLRRSPDKTRLYTGNQFGGTISVIDIARRAVIATIPVGRKPIDLAISPDGREIFVGNQDDDSVTVIDAATHAVTATVKLPESSAPHHLRYCPDGKTVFISSYRPGAGVLRMNSATRKITGHLPMDRFCGGMNFSPDQRVLYITDFPGGTISQVDPESMKVTRTLHTGAGAASPQVAE